MKHGNWIPISKAFIRDMPHDRPYTRLEAAYSIQYDYDNKNSVTVAGYSALWSWSRSRVTRFLSDMNVVIVYPENTKKRQNQKGQIALQIKSRTETDNKQIRLIENTYLQHEKDRPRTDEEQIKDRYHCSTKEPINLKPNNSISVPLKDGTFFIPENEYLDMLKKTYKNIDIGSEFNKMISWCISNPDKQKTKKGSKKFVNGWMSRANEKQKPIPKSIETESWF